MEEISNSQVSSLKQSSECILEEKEASPATGKLRVLVVTGGDEFDPSFWGLFDNPGLEIIKVDEAASGKCFLSGDVSGFDAIVLYDIWEEITGDEQKKFLDILQKGQGLVVLHHAMADYQDWPEFARIAGGRFFFKPARLEDTDYAISLCKHDVQHKICIADRNHPVTRDLTDFEILDETYKGYWIDPDAHILLTTSEPTSERIIGWSKTYGKAKVVTIQPGHGGKESEKTAYTSPSYKRLLLQAIRFVAGKNG